MVEAKKPAQKPEKEEKKGAKKPASKEQATVLESKKSESSAAKETPASTKRGKKAKRQVLKGQAHIQCTYNNTMVAISDLNGGTLGWSSSGLLGFKGAKKSTPYAATQVVADVTEKIRKNQVKELEVYVKGVGSGREAAIRALSNNGFTLTLIKDITPIPHNGCRPKRPRRV